MSAAWSEVSVDTVKNSFLACSLTSELDGSEDHLIHDKLGDALHATYENDAEIDDEAVDLLFGDSDDDESFLGFTDQESSDED